MTRLELKKRAKANLSGNLFQIILVTIVMNVVFALLNIPNIISTFRNIDKQLPFFILA